MILRNIDALLGPGLLHAHRTTIRMTDKFVGIKKGASKQDSLDCEGLVAVPGLINAHTHIGDSVAKDAGAGKDAASRIHPVRGAKRRILESTDDRTLIRYMKRSAKSMIECGTTTFVDFREGGLYGVSLLRRAIGGLAIRPVILGRIESYDSTAKVRANTKPAESRKTAVDLLLKECDGLGLSGANENSDSSLVQYSRTTKLRAIHAAETVAGERFSRRNTGRSEATRALIAHPHFVVHMTQATPTQMRRVASRTRGVVVCPRANASLAEGAPDIAALVRAGCNVALGTDNVMLNSPNMLSEMDYAWKSTMAISHAPLDPRLVLCMATSNAGKMLGRRMGAISSGMHADCVLFDMSDIDVAPAQNIHAAIVGRATKRTVRAVIIGGKVVHGRI